MDPAGVRQVTRPLEKKPPDILILDDDLMSEGELLRAYGVQSPVELVQMAPFHADRRYPDNDMPDMDDHGVPDRCRNGHDLSIAADVKLWTRTRKDGTEHHGWTCRVCKRNIRNLNYRREKAKAAKLPKKARKIVPGSIDADIEVCRLNTKIAAAQDVLELAMPWERKVMEQALAKMIERKDGLDRSIRAANRRALDQEVDD